MTMSRRTFLASTAVMGSALALAPVSKENARYTACVIGDTKNGGYGHDLHLSFDLNPDVRLTGLADPDEAGRGKRAAECGVENTYADYRDMLEKENPDIVIVGPRWTTTHKDYVLTCAEAGCHGFLEKHLCTDLEEADVMIDAVNAKNLKWGLAYNFRMVPLFKDIKRLIVDEKLLGTLVELRARGKEDARAGGEDLIVLGTHLFDLMTYFMGDPLWCQSDITHRGEAAKPEHVQEGTEPLGPIVGNRLHASYGFAQGVVGTFSSMFTKEGNGLRWGLDICGTKGVVSIRMNTKDGLPLVHWLDDSIWNSAVRNTAWKPLPGIEPYTYEDAVRERYLPITQSISDCIGTENKPTATFEHGRRAQEMIQGCFASHVRGGAKVALPMTERAHPLKGWS